MITLHDIG